MRSFLTLTTVAAVMVATVAAPAFSRESDHLVWHGKVHLPASRVPARESGLQPSAKYIPSAGHFVQRGKAQVWVPGEAATASRESADTHSDSGGKGRFVQQGKAQFWVPDSK